MYVATLGTFVNVTGKDTVSVYAPVADMVNEYVHEDATSHEATPWFEAMLYDLHSLAVKAENDTAIGPFVKIIVPDGSFHVCDTYIVPHANGPYSVNTELAAITSHHASNPDRSKLVASPVAFSIPSVSVYIVLLSKIFVTGILNEVFHHVNFVPLDLFVKAFAK